MEKKETFIHIEIKIGQISLQRYPMEQTKWHGMERSELNLLFLKREVSLNGVNRISIY